MKKEAIAIFLFLIFPSVIAISTDLKQTYQPQETIIIEISGNILQPISNSDVQLLRNHIPVAFQYDLKKISDKYYLWGTAPLNENNYTLAINNIATTEAGSTVIETFSQNFSVSGDLVSYSVSPGFKISNLGTQLVFTINSNSDQTQTINSDFPSEQSITVSSGQSTIILETSSSTQGFRRIQLGMYSIPVFLVEQINQNQQSSTNLRFFPESIKSILLLGQAQSYPFRIINDGETPSFNLAFQYDTNIFEINPFTIPTIQPNSSAEFALSLKIQNTPVVENINLLMQGNPSFSKSFSVNITYTNDANQTGTPYLENFSRTNYYCSELSGKFCTADETCSGETISALDGQCCIGACLIQESQGSLAWIGWLIGGIIVIVLIIVGMKYKKSKQISSKLSTK